MRIFVVEDDVQLARQITSALTEATEKGLRAPVASSLLSYGALKLLPFWDLLRGDPRFEKIVAPLAPKL
jgi:hypothetical protein